MVQASWPYKEAVVSGVKPVQYLRVLACFLRHSRVQRVCKDDFQIHAKSLAFITNERLQTKQVQKLVARCGK